jgi:transcription initiation factor TFIIH subunit 2
MAHNIRDDDEGGVSYSWESSMKRTWDSVKVDSEGNLVTFNPDKERSKRAKLQRMTQSVRRGLIRYMIVFIDASLSASANDYRPSRLEVVKSSIEKFVVDYFDQNPISQLSLALTRDRGAEKITDLSGNSKIHIHALHGIQTTQGLASLQYILMQAMAILKHIPDYGCREILIIYTSLSTCDPGDIFTTFEVHQLYSQQAYSN